MTEGIAPSADGSPPGRFVHRRTGMVPREHPHDLPGHPGLQRLHGLDQVSTGLHASQLLGSDEVPSLPGERGEQLVEVRRFDDAVAHQLLGHPYGVVTEHAHAEASDPAGETHANVPTPDDPNSEGAQPAQGTDRGIPWAARRGG